MSFSWFAPKWGCVRVSGPDAVSWLNGIVTCDVAASRSNRAVWGALLTKQGKVQSEFFAIYEDAGLFLAIVGGDAASTVETLDGYLVMEDAEVELSSCRFLFRTGRSDGEAESDWDTQLVPHPAPPLGEEATLFVLEPSRIETLKRNPGAHFWSDADFEEFRVRLGKPQFGVDYDERDNLHAAGLERKVVDWSKGCYLGQEVVCMQEMRGKVRRRLVAFSLSDRLSSGHGNAPFSLQDASGNVVGEITSVVEDRGIAKVAAPHDVAGTELQVVSDSLGGPIFASIK